MREIKFRAWDKEDKKMKEVSTLDFADWWVATGYQDGERNSFKNEETDRHILMQYTRLKDENGVEIYEGDILKFGYKNGYIDYSTKQARYNIYFKESAGLIQMNIDYNKMKGAEIIGNIYMKMLICWRL